MFVSNLPIRRLSVLCFLVLVAALPTTAFTQLTPGIVSRPTADPTIFAAGADWYVGGEPLIFAGHSYERTGASVFFNGQVMVPVGDYRGIPIYVDTTKEPYSILYVAIAERLMQPYERRRVGELAGTAGSTAPAQPIQRDAEVPAGTAGTTAGGGPIGTVGPGAPVPPPAPSPGTTATPSTTPGRVTIGQRSARHAPAGSGVWVTYGGRRWTQAGPARPFSASELTRIGTLRGFPVYARRDEQAQPETIFLPVANGKVAPYRRQPPRVSGAEEPPASARQENSLEHHSTGRHVR